ncbi:hypothetical protein ACE1BH_22360, partial [Aeromonas jandaei]
MKRITKTALLNNLRTITLSMLFTASALAVEQETLLITIVSASVGYGTLVDSDVQYLAQSGRLDTVCSRTFLENAEITLSDAQGIERPITDYCLIPTGWNGLGGDELEWTDPTNGTKQSTRNASITTSYQTPLDRKKARLIQSCFKLPQQHDMNGTLAVQGMLRGPTIE